MKQEMFDHLVDYMEDHGGMPEGVMDKINPEDSIDDQLSFLIGQLCLPENGDIEMVRGILSLEFDPADVDEVVFDNFDMFF